MISIEELNESEVVGDEKEPGTLGLKEEAITIIEPPTDSGSLQIDTKPRSSIRIPSEGVTKLDIDRLLDQYDLDSVTQVNPIYGVGENQGRQHAVPILSFAGLKFGLAKAGLFGLC